MKKNTVYEELREKLTGGLLVCLVDHFSSDISSGRISAEDCVIRELQIVDGAGLIVSVIVRDNYKDTANIVYALFHGDDKGYISSFIPEMISRDEAMTLLNNPSKSRA